MQRSPLVALTVCVLAAGCGSASDSKDAASADAAPGDGTHADATVGDAAAGDGAGGDAGSDRNPAAFVLMVAETPPGPTVATNLWAGVLRFDVAGGGAMLVTGAGIDRAALSDPAGLAFREVSSEVFVGNRHGGNSGDGVAGSIARFIYDRARGTLTPNGKITGNGLSGVHQLAFNPTSGELFAASFGQGPEPVGGGISRFTFDAGGSAVANGTLGDGAGRGVVVAPDGKRLYYTDGGTLIRQFDLGTGKELLPFLVNSPVMFRLHSMAIRKDQLYATGLDNNLVFRLTIAADDSLTTKDTITADAPASITFSPDGLEMFTTGHVSSYLINRFNYDAATDTWTQTTKVATTTPMGAIVTFK